MKKSRRNLYIRLLYLSLTPVILCCHQAGKSDLKTINDMSKSFNQGTFGYDAEFLANHNVATVVLKDPASDACVLIAPGLQGRVMTSTSGGDAGLSYGWLNYRLFDSASINDQFNPFGGEERLWLGPEGGPYSIYFKKGTPQIFANWKVPAELDTRPFEIVKQDVASITFEKNFTLENYSGTSMSIGIERTVRILSHDEIQKYLGIASPASVKAVAYQSENSLINKGDNNWTKENGFLSVWMLSMFKPSEKGVVFIPFTPGPEKELGNKVNADYFGTVPADRLKVEDNMLFFKVDGKYRSKIGISPSRALPYAGSYDPEQKVLTVLWYSKPESTSEYVNSKWGEQDHPLRGDVINSYNDGPVEDGSIMGPFYEIESSSPAALLKAGEKVQHIQRIFHFTGSEELLDPIAESIFGISLAEIKTSFNK